MRGSRRAACCVPRPRLAEVRRSWFVWRMCLMGVCSWSLHTYRRSQGKIADRNIMGSCSWLGRSKPANSILRRGGSKVPGAVWGGSTWIPLSIQRPNGRETHRGFRFLGPGRSGDTWLFFFPGTSAERTYPAGLGPGRDRRAFGGPTRPGILRCFVLIKCQEELVVRSPGLSSLNCLLSIKIGNRRGQGHRCLRLAKGRPRPPPV